jgi:hypothetical protein
MTGVRVSVTTATRSATCTSASSAPRVTVASRFSGKKTSQIVTACFQRGGAERGAGARRAALTSVATGASNQPSIPVRRSVRVISASPCAERSHHCRSGDESHAASDCWSANRQSMCHSSAPPRGRTQPPPRNPGKSSAMLRPARIQAVISRACAGSARRVKETVTGRSSGATGASVLMPSRIAVRRAPRRP